VKNDLFFFPIAVIYLFVFSFQVHQIPFFFYFFFFNLLLFLITFFYFFYSNMGRKKGK